MARVSDISVLQFTVFNSRMCLSREAEKYFIILGHLGKHDFLLFVVCLTVMVSSYVVSVIWDLFC